MSATRTTPQPYDKNIDYYVDRDTLTLKGKIIVTGSPKQTPIPGQSGSVYTCYPTLKWRREGADKEETFELTLKGVRIPFDISATSEEGNVVKIKRNATVAIMLNDEHEAHQKADPRRTEEMIHFLISNAEMELLKFWSLDVHAKSFGSSAGNTLFHPVGIYMTHPKMPESLVSACGFTTMTKIPNKAKSIILQKGSISRLEVPLDPESGKLQWLDGKDSWKCTDVKCYDSLMARAVEARMKAKIGRDYKLPTFDGAELEGLGNHYSLDELERIFCRGRLIEQIVIRFSSGILRGDGICRLKPTIKKVLYDTRVVGAQSDNFDVPEEEVERFMQRIEQEGRVLSGGSHHDEDETSQFGAPPMVATSMSDSISI